MGKLISIETSKHSALFRRILDTYRSGAQIRIDSRSYGEDQVDELISIWCTNRKIRHTHDFELARAGRTLFRFHDGPANLWAAYTELPFVRQLREERIIRYRVVTIERHEPGCFGWLIRAVPTSLRRLGVLFSRSKVR